MTRWRVIFTRYFQLFVSEGRVIRGKKWHDFCCIPATMKGTSGVKGERMRLYKDTVAKWLSRLLLAAILVLVGWFSIMTIRDYGRESGAARQTLLEKGSVLIRALESGTRVGMGMRMHHAQQQTLLEEMAVQPAIQVIKIIQMNLIEIKQTVRNSLQIIQYITTVNTVTITQLYIISPKIASTSESWLPIPKGSGKLPDMTS